LDKWFAGTGVGLSAEHGCFYRHPDRMKSFDPNEQFGSREENGIEKKVVTPKNNGWFALVDQVDPSWRDTLRPLFQHYTERTPGSFIEEKEV